MNFFEEIDFKIIPNKLGDIYKIANSEEFPGFVKGDIYFSEVKPRVKKTWRRHTKLNCIIFVVFGEVLIKLKPDLNEEEITKRLFLTKSKMIKISPGSWYSFENKYENSCLLFVMLDGKHDDNEVERL